MSAVRAWARDLGVGARFALAGGRSGWARTTLTAVGVGLGVVVLLLAASIPSALEARAQRQDAREIGQGTQVPPGPDTVLVLSADTEYRGRTVEGRQLQPDAGEATTATPPPGLDAFPAPGEMVVSPALGRLLDSPDGRLLAERLTYERAGTIAPEGLSGPAELYYYVGTDALGDNAVRVAEFGHRSMGEPLSPALTLLVLVICVGLLMPVAVFIATAVRFGGELRDRRLAALRLLGADMTMTRRIAAGESLAGSLLGLLLGGAGFLLLRQYLSGVTVLDISAYPADIVPEGSLTLLVLITVPASALAVTLFALRGVTIEPLGVVRHAEGRPRRLSWRLVPVLLGLGLLVPLVSSFSAADDGTLTQAAVGIVLLLAGSTIVLPWLVERLVGGLGGGPLSWQLATRRLQLGSGPAARAVSGITVAVAAATALSMLFSGVRSEETVETGQDPDRAQLEVFAPLTNGEDSTRLIGALESLPGVEGALGMVTGSGVGLGGSAYQSTVTVGDCGTLRELTELAGCSEGDVFFVDDGEFAPRPGDRLDLSGEAGGDPAGVWTVPESIASVGSRPDPGGTTRSGIFATPAALDPELLAGASTSVLLRLDPDDRDTVERVRNVAWHRAEQAAVWEMATERPSWNIERIQTGLLVGATGVLLLIGASMVVTTVEQLRERKRLLSALIAVGTRRRTLSASILWQTAIPVVLGLTMASAVGTALGALLMGMVDLPVGDWSAFLPMAVVGAGVIALVTLVSLPSLWYVMRPDGLRTE